MAPKMTEKKPLTDGTDGEVIGAVALDSDEVGDSRKDHKKMPNAMSLAFKRVSRDLILWADQFIDLGMNVFSVVMKILGPCLICLAICLIGFVTYTYFYYFFPSIAHLGTPLQSAITLIGLFLLMGILYNYIKSICTAPGTPPEYETALAEYDANVEGKNSRNKPKQCLKCSPSRLKPPRTHHCSVCRKCILKMDHHCPWINNCVGYWNYRYFCLFLLYLALGCLFTIAAFFRPFSESMFFVRRKVPHRMSFNGRQCIMTSFMICCSIFVALSILGGFHVYLVLTNQTTIEFQTNLLRRREARKNGEFFRNPYDLGRARNFQQVFGQSPFCRFKWMLSCLSIVSTSDGMKFQSL